MNLPSIWNQSSDLSRLAEVPRLPRLPIAMVERLKEIDGAMSKEGWGRYSISEAAALTDDERAWLVDDYLPAFERQMASGTSDALDDRLDRFAFGFGQLRNLDAAAVRGTVLNWREAVEEFPLLAVDQACKSWNAGRFAWQKTGLVPNPDELARAVRETEARMRADLRPIRDALAAKVITAAPPQQMLPAPGRPCTVADAVAELRASIVASTTMPGPERDPQPKPERYSKGYLADLEARRARREAGTTL